MQIQFNNRGIDKAIGEVWKRALRDALGDKLEPLLQKHAGEMARLQVVLSREDKNGTRLSATAYLHLPGKKIVTATASHGDLTELARSLAQALFRQVEKHFNRLRGEDLYKRKARRERLRELKAQIAALPDTVVQDAKITLEPLLPKLEAVARRELAYLHANGDLPEGQPTLREVVDEAVARAEAEWETAPNERTAFMRLLKNLFAVINHEIADSRQYESGQALTIDAQNMADEDDGDAQALDESDRYDDVLNLTDVFVAHETPDVSSSAKEDECYRALGHRALAFEVLKDLPVLWRRVFLLVRVDGWDTRSVMEILQVQLKEELIAKWLEQAEAFLVTRLEEAGVACDGAAWIHSVDWQDASVAAIDSL